MKISVSAYTLLLSCGVIHLASSFLTEDIKNEIVNLQNTLRRTYAHGGVNGGPIVSNMVKLDWDVDLENFAQETLEVHCTIDNSPVLDSLRHLSLNSNLKLNSNGNFTGDIISWYEEIINNNFRPEHLACLPYSHCSQAYQLLNSYHKRTGCAYKRHCRENMNVFLCLYDKQKSSPPFNFINPGNLCTKCDNDRPFCEGGLCVACRSNPEIRSCDCRKTCQRAGVGNGTLSQNTCTCTCVYGMGPNCDEPCINPEVYADYDMCEMVTPGECSDPGFAQMLAHFCPEQCVCNAFRFEGSSGTASSCPGWGWITNL